MALPIVSRATRVAAAAEWLREYLAANGGTVAALEVTPAAHDAGHTEPILKFAKPKAGVRSVYRHDAWYWTTDPAPARPAPNLSPRHAARRARIQAAPPVKNYLRPLVAARVEQGMTQKALADVMGRYPSVVSSMENLTYDDITIGTLRDWCTALGYQLKIELVPEDTP